VTDQASYRILYFNQGVFKTRDDVKLQVAKDGDMWLISVPEKECYRFSEAVLTGG
jgi:hypothetical protein